MPVTASLLAFYCSSASWGGLEMNTLRFAQWMQSMGYRVALYAVAGSPLEEAARSTTVEVRQVRRNAKYFDFINAWRIRRRFRADGVHTVWYRDNRDLDVLAWAKRFSGGGFRLVYQQAMQLSVKKRDPVHTFRYRAIDCWIAPLHFLAEEVRTHTRFPPERIRVIPLAIDTDTFFRGRLERTMARRHFGLDEGFTWIGVAGRIERLKGQHVAIEAVARLRCEFPDLRLAIAGEPTRGSSGEYYDYLRQRCTELQLDDRVRFLPFTREVSSFFTAVDLCAMTSAGETFGMVTIEAMVCGCPVVGTRRSGTPELLGDGRYGMLVAPSDSEALAEAIGSLLRDPEKRLSLGADGRAYALAHFSHVNVCEKIATEVLRTLPREASQA
jgi:glycosyltransferase involved in cell wall biosynthesis